MTTQLPLLPAASDGEQRVVRCRDCHRPLYGAEARALQQGERCRDEEYAARQHAVEQDVLPGL